MAVTIVVENGTKVADANAYIDVAYFRDFHETRGLAAAALTADPFSDDAVAAAIIRATDYVDKRFGNKFVGWRYGRESDQSLEWPRLDARDINNVFIYSNEIPKGLKKAVAEYAKISLYIGELLKNPAPMFNSVDPVTGITTVNQGGILERDRSKVGPIEEEKWFSQQQWRLVLNGRAAGMESQMVSMVNLPEYPAADEWLNSIVRTSLPTQLVRG